MITIRDICLQFGGRVLFGGISATIGARDRIGLVGANGAGKTTLLRILAGEQEADSGEVEMANYASIGYLPQDGLHATGTALVPEVESAMEEVATLRERHDDAVADLERHATDSADYRECLDIIGELEHRLDELEAHKLRSRVEKVLTGLGFEETDFERDTGEFSGGWQMRIALAKLLLREPSLLILDEPTNHLDIDSLRWIEKYLGGYEGSLLVVSHDRAFLDGLTTTTYHLSMGRLEVYQGNYSFFEIEAAERREQREQAAKSQQKQIEKTEAFINRFRAKASKASQVQSRIKMLNRIERIETESEEAGFTFKFPPVKRAGQWVLRTEGLDKAYGEIRLFSRFDFQVDRGDRIAIVGANGAGKSTLARMLAGAEPPDGGKREVGYAAEVSWFAQHQGDELDPEATVLQVGEQSLPDDSVNRNVRSVLGSFLFRGDDVFKPVKVLSGGEKNRLALAKMLLRPANVLILDEPTNHLDMRAKAILQQALMDYEGTLLIVSHDRDFLDPLVNKVLEIRKGGKARVFPGNVSDYVAKVEAEEATFARGDIKTNGRATAAAQKAANDPKTNPKERRRLEAEKRQRLAPLKKQLAADEATIAELEEKIAKAEQAMMDPAFFKRGNDTAREMEEYEGWKRRLDRTMASWEKAQSAVEALEQTN